MRFAIAAACLALLISGCSIALDDGIYGAPGKFDFLDCSNIANRAKAASSREIELTEIMSRAQDGASGPVINALVYQDELNTVRAELQALRKTADDKRCAPIITPETHALEPVH